LNNLNEHLLSASKLQAIKEHEILIKNKDNNDTQQDINKQHIN